MSNQIHIREATIKDKNLLVHLIRDSFQTVADKFGLTRLNCPKHPSNCSLDWIEHDLARGVIYYILEIKNNPVGCAALERAASDLFYLERLAILPNRRKNGFGKMLVDFVFEQSRVRGAKKISIAIIDEDTDLKHWYLKMGFDLTGSKKFDHLPFLVTFMKYDLY